MVKFGFPNHWELQIYWPYVGKNSYGYYVQLRTNFVIGRRAVAMSILGFGFGLAQDEFNTRIRESEKSK